MSPRTAARRSVLPAVFIALSAAVAGAQTPPSTLTSASCTPDQLAQFCPNAKPDTPDLATCAQQHAADCQKQNQEAALAEAKAKLAANNPCMSDAQRDCPGKWAGTPEYKTCLKSHQSDLSPACAAWSKKHAAQGRKPGDDICIDDAKKYCTGLTTADGVKFSNCMTSNYGALSPACQAKFKNLVQYKSINPTP